MSGSLIRARATVTALVFVGYVGISQGVGNFYPFSVFDMFAHTTRASSRIAARSAGRRAVEVERFVGWSCDAPLAEDPGRCGPLGSFETTDYADREAFDWIRGHAGDGARGEPVDVLRRIFRVGDRPGPISVEDCVLARCRAVPR